MRWTPYAEIINNKGSHIVAITFTSFFYLLSRGELHIKSGLHIHAITKKLMVFPDPAKLCPLGHSVHKMSDYLVDQTTSTYFSIADVLVAIVFYILHIALFPTVLFHIAKDSELL